jgi:hypothetical protein
MEKIDPDAPREQTFESYWQSYIDDARAGDTRAARQVMAVCIRFLRGNDFPETTGIENRPGFVPEPLSSYLAKTLAAAMAVPSKEVGREMGMGNPEKPPRNEAQLIEFFDRYSSLVKGEIPKDSARRTQVLKDVARQMGINPRSAERYWSEDHFGVKEFGLPPPTYEADADIHQLLETIIKHYPLYNRPIKNGNTTRRPASTYVVKKISSQTNEDFSTVELCLGAIEDAVADVFEPPKGGDPDDQLLADLATFISQYNSIMNSPVEYATDTLPRRRKRAVKQIMSHMGKDLPSGKRYWKTLRRAAERIKTASTNYDILD